MILKVQKYNNKNKKIYFIFSLYFLLSFTRQKIFPRKSILMQIITL